MVGAQACYRVDFDSKSDWSRMECGSQKGYEDDEMMEVGSADEAEGSSDGSDVENELDEELDDEEDEEDIDELQDLLEEEEIHGLSHRRSTDEPSSSKGLQQAPSSNSGLSDEIAVRNESDTTALFHSTHPGVTIRRGPGRPRKGHMTVSPLQKNPSLKWSCSGLQAPKSNGSRGPYGPRKKRDYLEGVSSSHDLSGVSPSPPHELLSQYSSMDDMDNEQSNQIVDKCATSEDLLPVIPDKWPGKVCAICALGEKSTLGQGELLQVAISSTFDVENAKIKSQLDDSDPSSNGDKCLVTTPTTPAISQRRQMKFNRNLSVSGSECLDELSMVGFVDEPALVNIFEVSGFFYIHEACARWCPGVTVDNNGRVRGAENAILEALGKKCAHCSHLGASLACKADGCSKYFHLPCAAASGCFQDLSRTVTVCSMHLHLVRPNFAGDVVCAMCNDLGNIHNLIMCSRCGKHLHGACYGVGSSGSVRAGWQCSTCRQCQACRVPSERSKLLICDHCDKAYHQQCLRPLVSQVPKFGWKCKSCRICTDCGSRTPGAGQSSRWHNHFTVCDSCYQQRNKGQACPVCRRAYRHTAIKEMVQCTSCRKYVHGACDSDAELATYQAKKAAAPDYAYVCTVCKQYATRPAPVFKRCSIDDVDFSQDSYLYADDSLSGMDIDTVEKEGGDEVPRNLTGFGLGRGKPLAAVKMMKRRMPFGNMSYGNRPKGKLGLKKAKGMVDFPRKRGPKGKMQGGENRLVLCSAKDKFVLNQDVCVMCGALGLDQEGCLISCAQCGQCYHPYCVSIKVSKVILTKGWRCLDCTVCEGCGQRHDESRLILCDDCDISYHIYCMNPPLDFVPRGNWKCKWCAMCQLCGSSDPGFNCTWMNSFSHCGPCASLQVCPVCNEEYAEGQMIIKCFQCARWLHGTCDQIKTDEDAEKCSADGYNCVLCRPRDVPPPHLIPVPVAPKPPTPCKSPVHSGLKKLDAKGRANNSKKVPKVNPNASYFLDGVCLSEHGNVQIKTLTLEQPKKKRANAKGGAGKGGDAEAGILATIESVVSGGKLDGMMPGNQITPRDGAPVQLLPDGRPPEAPEGFQICTSDNGVQVWRRKRTRNLNKLGIGGFSVRTRILKPKDEDVFAESLSGNGFSPSMEPNLSHATSVYSVSSALLTPTTPTGEEKPKRKPNRKKPKNKLMENFPIYLQDAFFGRDLLDVSKEQTLKEVGESDDEKAAPATLASGIQLSQEELKEMENIKARKINEMTLAAHAKQQSEQSRVTVAVPSTANTSSNKGAKASEEEADADDEEALKDILPMNLLEGEDLVDMDNLMGDDDDLTKTNLDEMGETNGAGSETAENKDELTDILSPHFNLESMVRDSGLPNMDCKDVEEIFKGVLTDESQESQESSTFRISNMSMGQTQSQHSMVSPSQPAPPTPTMPTTSPMPRAQPISMGQQQNLASPMGFPPASPYHSEYSNSPQFSPAFSEPPSPWCQAPTPDQPGHEGSASLQDAPTSYNQRSSLKMEQDELLGSGSTMASVLYSNINHPEWKTEYPIWAERCKQIVKKWRTLSTESRAPYLQNARENRATQRMKKSQQMPSASSPAVKQEAAAGRAPSAAAGAAAASAATVVPSVTPPLLKKPSMTSTTSMTTASTALMKSATILTPPPQTTTPTSSTNADLEDQDKIIAQQKNTREAQEERKWKQQQAMRQQQQQMQQMIHEQRVQGNGMGIPRMHRPMDNQGILNLPPPSPVFLPDGSQTAAPVTSQLHVATGQDPSTSPMASPSPGSRPQFTQPLKGQDVFSPPQTSSQPQQQEDFNNQDFQQSGADPYAQPPLTPRPQPQKQPTTPTQAQPTFQAPRPVDPYAQPPGTPRPQPQQTFIPPAAPLPQQRQAFVTPRPVGPLDPYSQPPGTPRPVDPYAQPPGTPRPGTDDQSGFQMNQTNPEMTRQLRDLLQRNQFKKLEDEQLVPGQNNRIWPQEQRVEVQQQQQPQQQQQLQQFDNQGQQSSQEQEVANRAVSDNTFRHPLPPGMRPRVPGPQQMLVRGPQGQIIRQAMPNMDPRMRLLLQQHQQTQRLINQNPGANMQQQQQMFNQQSPQQPNQPQFVANMAVQPRMQGPRVPMEHMVQQRPQLPFPKQESNTHIMHQQQQQQRPLLRQMSNVESVVPNAIVPGMQPGQRLIRTMSGPPVMTEQPNMNQQQRMPTPSMQMEQQLPGIVAASAPVSATPQAAPVASAEVPSQEIPPHLAEEIEKLEQEGVSSLLELGDDDDELLGLGADFNILLYADPDLDAAPGGVKTNILDFEQEENEDKKDGPSRNTAQSQERTADATQPAMQPQANVTPQVPQQAVIQPQVPPNVTMRPQMQAKPFQQTFQGQQNPQGMMRPQMQGVQQRMVHPQQTMSGKPRLMQPMGPASQMLQSVGQARMMAGKPGVVPPNASLVPPPPYPGPPPPYPGATQQRPSLQQQSLHMQQQQQRRPLLLQSTLQEQPLLLEDLLEQEKREQERQQAAQALQDPNAAQSDANSQSLHVSDMDFERLKADVMRSPNSGGSPGLSPPNIPGVGVMQPGQVPLRPPFTPAIRQSMQPQQQQWNPTMQQSQQMPQQIPQQMVNVQRPVVPMNQPQPVPLPQPQLEQVPRVQQIPPPPTPPDNIVTEQDRQAVVAYEKWLHGQHAAISNQLQNLEMQVSKYRKAKKSLSSKQRQLRKQQMELPPNDLSELARIGKEQQVIQKQLEQSRKLNKQHGMIIQDYKTKMQKRQPPNMMSNSPSPSSIGVHLSPLGPPTHNIPASASPALSTSPAISAMQQQSPLHSPVPHSPGPNVLAQSPGNVAQMSPRSLQPSPRLGTPHSQGDENQFSPSPSAPMQSPQTPVQRLTSPQGQMRMASPQQTMGQPMARPMQGQFPQPNQQYSEQMRNMMGQKFIRPDMQQGMSPSGVQMGQQPRPRMVAMQNMQNQMYMQQQQQQQMQNQQMQSQQMQNQNFQQVPMQQAQQQQQQRMAAYQQSIGSPQQQQQQQQQRTVQFPASPMGSPQTQNQQSQQMRIQGGMPFPASPLGSPQQMRVNPNMPYPQSPLGSPQQMRVMHSPLGSPQPNMMIQPNASPMRRPSGSSGPSPLPPERPLSTENPLTPRTPGAQYHDMSQDGSGGGGGGNMMPAVSGGGGFNHHLIPIPPELRHIRYCKLGLVGGAPMWMENGGGGLGAGKPPSSSSQQSNNPAAGSSNQTESADSDIEAAVLSNMKDITVVVVGSSPASSVDDVEQSLASLVENIGDPHVEEEALIRKTEDAVDENKIVETLDELENEVDMKDEEDLLKTVDEHVEKTTSMERPSFVAHSATDTPASPDPENLGSPDPELMAEAECHLDETMNNEEKPAPVEVEPAPQPPPPSPPKAEQQKIEPPPPLQYPTVTRMPQISFETPNESSHVEEALKSVECEIKVEKEAQKEAESVKVAETPSLLQQLVEKKEEDTVDRSLPEPLRKMGELRQNVLLKQLLQNSACSTSQSSGSVSVPSLEAQLARPVPPTHSRLIPPLLNETPQNRPQMLRLPGVQQQPTSIIRPHQLIMNKDLMPHIPSQPLAAPQRPMLVQQNQQLNQQLQQRSSPGPASQASQPLSQPLQQQQQHQPQVPHQQPQQAQPIQQQQPQQQLPQQQLPQQQYQPQQQPQSQQHQMQPQQHQMQPQQHQMQPQQQQLLQHQPKLQIPTPPPQPARTPPQVSRTPPQQQHLQQTQAIQQILQAQIKKEAAEQQQMLQASTTPPQPAATPPVQSAQEASSLQQQAPNLLRHIQQVVAPVEIKKEVEEQSVTPQSSRENTMDIDQNSCDNIIQPTETSAADLKKLKRRQYQQKRRQSAGKEGGPTPKKRSRKLSSTSQGSSKIEEDYDSYIDHLMPQVRQLPSLNVLEPELGRNYAVCPVFGAGDLAKLVPHAHNGTLIGRFGKANIPSVSDFYNTKPFGDLPQIQPDTPTSSQNGFYDQEFAPLKLESDEANRDREDSPDTVVSTSSPEFFMLDSHYRFPGLRLIKEDDSDTEEKEALRRASPVIPLLTPTPIRVRPGITFKDLLDLDKENMGGASGLVMRSRWGSSPTVPLRETGNITVTLTLSATAARDVEGALSGLARLLRLPTPLQFSVADTTTQPDYKLGVYRIRGLDGKEGAAINVQSILNDARFCRQCKCWAKNYISKRASDLPQNILSINDVGQTTMEKGIASKQINHSSLLKKSEKKAAEAKKNGTVKEEPMEVDPPPGPPPPPPSLKGIRFKTWSPGLQPPNKYKKPTDRELTDMLFRSGITLMPQKLPDDSRQCLFCHQMGDGPADGSGRLLNYDVDKWVHLNCALWSSDVYETENGALMNVEQALQQGLSQNCSVCGKHGATVKCFKTRCGSTYHLGCAVKDDCVFYKNKTAYCSAHIPKNEKESELTTLAVFRRVYVNRDENRQVAAVMHHSDQSHLLRVGSLIFLNVGQLLPHQLLNFHTQNYIYPIGYKIARIYWSMRSFNKRCRYICSIHDNAGRPEFRVLVQEANHPDLELKGTSARQVWMQIMEPMAAVRRGSGGVQVFPKFISGEDLFGLTEPAIIRVLESLPGIETLTDYKFKYGRNPLLELPLAVNPTGCARSEPKLRTHFKRPHTQRTGSVSIRPALVPAATPIGEATCPYSKQFVHSKSSQYKKMKLEWRNNVYLARSKIQGLGLYAARDLERHTMVIEYIGEIIRTELAEAREKQYEERNRGIYMFRLDEERVIDATLSGGLARYINHSCNPNCVAETVEVDRDFRIIIFAKRRINRGEELAYDYKFDIEDDQHKIPCLCGAPNSRKSLYTISTMAEGQLYSLKWNNYVDHIRTTFASLRVDRDLIDVTLSCEGKKITAHKMLLSACSPYFKSIFKENPCQHPVIIFRNIAFDDLAALIEFIYNGEVGVAEENLASFLNTAELLEVQGLTKSGQQAKKRNLETSPEEIKTASTSMLSVPLESELPLEANPLTSIPDISPESAAPLVSKRRRRASPPRKEDAAPNVSAVPVDEPVIEPFSDLPLKTETVDEEVSITSDHGQYVAEDDDMAQGDAYEGADESHELEQNDGQDGDHSAQEKDVSPVVTDVYSLSKQYSQRHIITRRQKHKPTNNEDRVPDPASVVSATLGAETADEPRDIQADQPRVIQIGNSFKCSVCGNTFRHYSGCSGHLKSHLGLTKCWICGRVSTNLWNLDMHLRVHRNVQCGHCGKTFSNALDLKRQHGLVCKRKKYKALVYVMAKK
ncbi:Hypothetical predicted protein [Cloeon dipterum]|uniref:Histone-lysine N-methyltransferase 2C n=1 Tax=Cloeon dipterum TaxID=197152 RepID=A0A8S1DDU6_9INSE|nr:Hypothetical predicted protein [Cloeon dipterum]